MAGLYYALMDLKGRVAAITGASSGIGLAIAHALAREGVTVDAGGAACRAAAAGGRGDSRSRRLR